MVVVDTDIAVFLLTKSNQGEGEKYGNDDHHSERVKLHEERGKHHGEWGTYTQGKGKAPRRKRKAL